MKKARYFFILAPLVLGVIIYILYRSKGLFYYNIIHYLNMTGHVEVARKMAKIYRALLPTWAIYSLPDGLWLFSMGATFLINRIKFLFNFLWFSFMFGITIGIEYIQKYYGGHGTSIGTYDRNDVIAYIYAYIAIVLLSIIINIVSHFKHKEIRHFKRKSISMENFRYTIIFSILGILPNMF